MKTYQNVMVGLAQTDSDVGLLDYVANFVRRAAPREIHCVHVLADAPDQGAQSAQTRLTEQVQRSFGALSAQLNIRCDVLPGPVLDRLLVSAAERKIDLLVVGHDRVHSGRHALARRLAMKAPCSVWMVPEGAPARLDRILVPVDYSRQSADCVAVATELARDAGAAMVFALHVYWNDARVTFDEYDQMLRNQERRQFDDFIADVDCHGVAVKPLFKEGANAAHTIHRVAEELGVDLVVMSTRGRSASAAILLGSVTEEAIIQTHCPLLVVKHFGSQMNLLQALLDPYFQNRGGPQFD